MSRLQHLAEQRRVGRQKNFNVTPIIEQPGSFALKHSRLFDEYQDAKRLRGCASSDILAYLPAGRRQVMDEYAPLFSHYEVVGMLTRQRNDLLASERPKLGPALPGAVLV